MLGDGHSGLLIDLQCADDAPAVGKRKPRRRLRIDLRKLAVQHLDALVFRSALQHFPFSGGRNRRKAPPGDQAVNIQPGSARDHSRLSA